MNFAGWERILKAEGSNSLQVVSNPQHPMQVLADGMLQPAFTGDQRLILHRDPCLAGCIVDRAMKSTLFLFFRGDHEHVDARVLPHSLSEMVYLAWTKSGQRRVDLGLADD